MTVYRGSAYPAEFYGNAFTGDAQNNLIHRMVLVPDGPTFKAVRGPREQATEFVRSSDNWFRPVNFVNAPDGTLYALDMSRAVIEAIHIPLDVMKHLDLKRGRDQGRIYRIAPPGFRYTPPPRLSRRTTAELVAALNRPDAWYRDTAHRLIRERRDPAAIEPLRKLIGAAAFPPTRVNALWSLEGLGALRDEDLAVALADPVPEVRAEAVALAARGWRARRICSGVSWNWSTTRILGCGSAWPSRWARRAMLAAVAALARIARRDGADRWIRAAVLSSCADDGRSTVRGAGDGTGGRRPRNCWSRSWRSSVRGTGPTRSVTSSTCWRPAKPGEPTSAGPRWSSRWPGACAGRAVGSRSIGPRPGPGPRWSRGWSSRPGRAALDPRRPSRRCWTPSRSWGRSTRRGRGASWWISSRRGGRWRSRSRRCGPWPRIATPTCRASCCRGCGRSSRRCDRPRSGRCSAAPTGPRPCCGR